MAKLVRRAGTAMLHTTSPVKSEEGMASHNPCGGAGDGHRAYIFGIGLGCALLLGFLWTYLLRIPALLSVTIWTMCFAVNAFLVVLGERHAPHHPPTSIGTLTHTHPPTYIHRHTCFSVKTFPLMRARSLSTYPSPLPFSRRAPHLADP